MCTKMFVREGLFDSPRQLRPTLAVYKHTSLQSEPLLSSIQNSVNKIDNDLLGPVTGRMYVCVYTHIYTHTDADKGLFRKKNSNSSVECNIYLRRISVHNTRKEMSERNPRLHHVLIIGHAERHG